MDSFELCQCFLHIPLPFESCFESYTLSFWYFNIVSQNTKRTHLMFTSASLCFCSSLLQSSSNSHLRATNPSIPRRCTWISTLFWAIVSCFCHLLLYLLLLLLDRLPHLPVLLPLLLLLLHDRPLEHLVLRLHSHQSLSREKPTDQFNLNSIPPLSPVLTRKCAQETQAPSYVWKQSLPGPLLSCSCSLHILDRPQLWRRACKSKY